MSNQIKDPSQENLSIGGPSIVATPVRTKKDRAKSRRKQTGSPIGQWKVNRLGMITIGVTIILLGGFMIPLTIGLVYYVSIQNSPQILPGVSSSGIQLSELTITEAAILLHKKWNLENEIQVSSDRASYLVTPGKIGLQLDPITTAEEAYSIGRSGSFIARINAIIDARFIGYDVNPIIQLNPSAARAGLEALEPVFNIPVKEPGLVYENGKFSSTKGEAGFAIDLNKSLRLLENNPAAILFSGSYPIKLVEIQPEMLDIKQMELEAQKYLDASPVLRFFDPIYNEWLEKQIPPEEVAGWIGLDTSTGSPELSLKVSNITEYLDRLNVDFSPDRYFDNSGLSEEIARSFEGSTVKTIFLRHFPTTYTVRPGDTLLRVGWNLGMPYWRIIDENPGINPDQLLTGQEIIIPSKDELIPLPVIENKRVVISIAKQRLWAYENGEQVAREVISTGIDRSPTQPGVFQVQAHIKSAYASIWDLTMPNFLAIYEAWPGFMNGIHGLPTLSNGRRLWGNILGRPASYGCIILDLEAARWLYNWAEDGVIVEITP